MHVLAAGGRDEDNNTVCILKTINIILKIYTRTS